MASIVKRAVLAAVCLGSFGCGAQPDGVIDEPTGEESLAAVTPECVNIVQLSDDAGLKYPNSGDQVTTSEAYDPNDNNSQWCLRLISSLRYNITPLSRPTKYLDAHRIASADYRAVLRDQKSGTSSADQVWTIFSDINGGYRAVQMSSGRYLDAYTSGDGGNAVTRTSQSDLTQNWDMPLANCSCN